MKTRKAPLLSALLFSLALCAALPASAATLRLATISHSPAKDIDEFQPLADYLGKNLKSQGVDRCEVVLTSSMKEMAALIKAGKADIYIDSPFPVLAVRSRAKIKIMLRRWKKGDAEYHSVIFVRKDSGIRSLDQLKGHIMAVEEPFSTVSYFLPKADLLSQGFKLEELPNAQTPVSPNSVGYVFSDDDLNTLAWVVKNQVAAGALSNVKFEKFSAKATGELEVIHRAMSVPRHLVTYRADMDAELVAEIRSTLTGMEHTPEGLKALAAFGDTRRFDELPKDAEQELAKIEKLSRLIQVELEK
ncbi:MAG: phosphate/phosphite/phosphonate ABC transporter substrate-binding protein [Nitrosomonadales bacterium]|nr:phosphate/phosphite/phosphonate ABC transporter substrate-binding protein [Nitrosomonadales bacterium]